MNWPALIRALHMGATVLLAGAYLFRFAVLPADVRSGQGGFERRLRPWLARTAVGGLGLALVTWVAWLASVAMRMSGSPLGEALHPEVLGPVLWQTSFGRVWLLRLALFVWLLLALLPPPAGRSGGWRRSLHATAAAPALLALLSLAGSGHALGAAPWQWAADALHLLGAGLWLGTLPGLLIVLGHAARDPQPGWRALATRVLARFSRLGMLAVALLIATGLVNTLRLVGSLSQLGATGYGRLLLAKLALFAVILVLAAVNRFVLTPRAVEAGQDFPGPALALRRNASVEFALGLCILAIVGVLGTLPPANAPPHAHEGMHGHAAR